MSVVTAAAGLPTTHGGIGPFVALVVVAGLGVVLRWIASPAKRRARWLVSPAHRRAARPRGVPASPAAATDYGLLVPAVAASSRAEADRLRAVLAGYGIRGTVAGPPRSARRPWIVLVFPSDAERARSLVGTPNP